MQLIQCWWPETAQSLTVDRAANWDGWDNWWIDHSATMQPCD